MAFLQSPITSISNKSFLMTEIKLYQDEKAFKRILTKPYALPGL